MKPVIAASLACLAFSAAVAHANEPYFPRNEKRFHRLDANKDGKLTPDELAPVLKRRQAVLDANGDQQVTTAEIDAALQKAMEKRRTRIMLLMDVNKDGMITTAELDTVLNDMFDKADTDDDGSVSLAEIQSFQRAKWRKEFLQRQAN